MKIARRALIGISAAMIMGAIGCGGGGGGGPVADVTGRIVLVSTGAPLAGAVVTVGGRSFTTLANGVFTLTNVSATSPTLGVTATGEKPLTQTLSPLTPNTTNDLGDIFLIDTTSAGGYDAIVVGSVVRSDTFAPVSGAKVRLSGQVTTTDASGNFRLTNIPSGLVTIPGSEVGRITPAAADKLEDKPITLDLPLGSSPPDNNLGAIPLSPPVGGVPPPPSNIRGKISLQGLTDLSGSTVTLINKATSTPVGSPQTTGADGFYGFFVVAGQYTVKVDHAGFQSKQQDVTLTKTDVPQDVNLTLVP